MDLQEKYTEIFTKILDEYKAEYKELQARPDTDDYIQDTEKVFDLWEVEEAISVIKDLIDSAEKLDSPEIVSKNFENKAKQYYEESEHEAEYPTFHWNGDHYYYFVYRGRYRVYKRLSNEIKNPENNYFVITTTATKPPPNSNS